MAEPKQYSFSYKELAELMVGELGLSDGLWGVQVKFGIAAANIGEGADSLRPAAIVPVMEIGLQRFDEPSGLTVDAAEVATKQHPSLVKVKAAIRKATTPNIRATRRAPSGRKRKK